MNIIYRNFLFISSIIWLFINVIILQKVLFVNNVILYVNIITIFLYFIILTQSNLLHDENDVKYNSIKLFLIVLVYSMTFLIVYKWIYYDDHSTYFSFNAADAIQYHDAAFENIYYSLIDTIREYFNVYLYDDVGAYIFVTLVYKIYPSPLAVDFCNVLLGAFCSIALFKISLYYMPRKYAFLCALSYFCSSFIIQLESSGLKEPLFLYIVVLCLLFYVKYIHHNKIKYLIFFGSLASTILLFRPAVLAFLLLSVGAGFLYQKRKINGYIFIVAMIASFYTISLLTELFGAFSSFEQSLSYQEKTIEIAGVNVAIYASVIAGLFGPLPTMIPVLGKQVTAIYSAGLVFRVLLSIPFWLCFLYIIRSKETSLYPFFIFVFGHMFSLIYIMESYELRFHVLHLPFVYLIAFYYFYIQSIPEKLDTKYNIKVNIASVVLLGLIIYWNLRIT
jgi:hypothetical protein